MFKPADLLYINFKAIKGGKTDCLILHVVKYLAGQRCGNMLKTHTSAVINYIITTTYY
jgi:hypothetical protein